MITATFAALSVLIAAISAGFGVRFAIRKDRLDTAAALEAQREQWRAEGRREAETDQQLHDNARQISELQERLRALTEGTGPS